MLCVTALLFIVGLVSSKPKDYQLPGVPPGTQRVVNKPFCFNSAAFAVTGYIEIATERLLGKAVKLSEQEIVDCHFMGCNATTVSQIVHWLKIQDRLAPAAQYPAFQGKEEGDGSSCRARRAPNALQIDLGELENIAKNDVEDAIKEHGAVFASINYDPEICPGYYRRKSEILDVDTDNLIKKGNKLDIYKDNNDDGFIDGYLEWFTGENGHVIDGLESSFGAHTVLIVGIYKKIEYIEEYYVVRDSRGDSYMRRGHFLMKRHTNACGIESKFRILKTMKKTEEPAVNSTNFCPLDYPKYCNITKTCTKADQDCQAQENNFVGYNPEKNAPYKSKDLPDKSSMPECVDQAGYEEKCKESAKVWKNCMSPQIQKQCPGSCFMCHRDTCEDRESDAGECTTYKRYCHLPSVRAMCAKTCQMHPLDCGTVQENIELLVGTAKPPQGKCYPPEILNGRVKSEGLLNAGDDLVVECDEGFVLTGEANQCVIQDLYGPDSRIIQECMAVGDESWTGTGADYKGAMEDTIENTKCANWLEVASTGRVDLGLDVAVGKAALKTGNHNFCRNTDTVKVAPWCMTFNIDLSVYEGREIEFQGEPIDTNNIVVRDAEVKYCVKVPRCEYVCDDPFDVLPEFFCVTGGPEMCYLSSPSGESNWSICNRYCCKEAAGCSVPESDSEFDLGDLDLFDFDI